MAQTIPIPTGSVVYLFALHLGLSFGWHIGTALDESEKSFDDGIRAAAIAFLKNAFQHYDLGIGISGIALAYILGVVNWPLLLAIVFVGFGLGLAFSDREDHPPEGMTKYVMRRVRASGSSSYKPEEE